MTTLLAVYWLMFNVGTVTPESQKTKGIETEILPNESEPGGNQLPPPPPQG